MWAWFSYEKCYYNIKNTHWMILLRISRALLMDFPAVSPPDVCLLQVTPCLNQITESLSGWIEFLFIRSSWDCNNMILCMQRCFLDMLITWHAAKRIKWWKHFVNHVDIMMFSTVISFLIGGGLYGLSHNAGGRRLF